MKLTYRDRIILLVLIAAVILIGGFFGLIKPRYNDIKENKQALTAAEEEWNGLDAKIQQIPGMKDKITEIYNASTKLSDDFQKEYKETEDLDKYMQKIVDECKLKISNLEVGAAGDTTLEYYYYTPVIPTTAIFDLADINGNYAKEVNKKLEESNALSQRTAENLLMQQYGISFKSTQENLWKFMDEIDKEKSMVIESVNIADTDFGVNPETGELIEGVETQTDSTGKTVGVSQVTLIVDIYSVYELDKPVLE